MLLRSLYVEDEFAFHVKNLVWLYKIKIWGGQAQNVNLEVNQTYCFMNFHIELWPTQISCNGKSLLDIHLTLLSQFWIAPKLYSDFEQTETFAKEIAKDFNGLVRPFPHNTCMRESQLATLLHLELKTVFKGVFMCDQIENLLVESTPLLIFSIPNQENNFLKVK